MRVLQSLLLTVLLFSGSSFAACPCEGEGESTTTTTTTPDESGKPSN